MASTIAKDIDHEVDVKKMEKAIHKADNSVLVWGIMAVIAIFIFTYIYSEVIKTPNAYRVSEMFKKLQLISSAAFSIGHGGNDAQKVMGIIGAAYVATHPDLYPDVSAALKDLPWVPLCMLYSHWTWYHEWGWKIVKPWAPKLLRYRHWKEFARSLRVHLLCL